jgi:hypothetical protein
MFQDMSYTGRILRKREKGDFKRVIAVLRGEMQMTCSRASMSVLLGLNIEGIDTLAPEMFEHRIARAY